MNRWLDEAIGVLSAGQALVLVTVAACQGSAPREPGARMIVTRDCFQGTIGGGQLEWRAIAEARELLASEQIRSRLVRYPLGAKLGQCCGGVVYLSFEVLTASALAWLHEARRLEDSGLPWGRYVSLGKDDAPCHLFSQNPRSQLEDKTLVTCAQKLLSNLNQAIALLPADGGADVMVEVTHPPSLVVMLFGAGHVGTALATLLHRLPMQLRWIDSREEADFMMRSDTTLAPTLSDDPVAEVDCAPPDSAYLVMTQSHALDFELIRAILTRQDFRYCGLIGSKSKRASFTGQLRLRGFDDTLLNRIRCPIGIDTVPGKEPEVIAVAVAAELLALRASQSGAPDRQPM